MQKYQINVKNNILMIIMAFFFVHFGWGEKGLADSMTMHDGFAQAYVLVHDSIKDLTI